MSARKRLNQAYATASLFLAAWIGLAFNSWAAFGIGAGSLLGLNFVGGNIRFTGFRR